MSAAGQPFAKLFDTPDYGQLLLKIDQADDEADVEVRLYAQPPGLGVCSFSCGFSDDESGDADTKARAFFDSLDQDATERMALPLWELAIDAAPDEPAP